MSIILQKRKNVLYLFFIFLLLVFVENLTLRFAINAFLSVAICYAIVLAWDRSLYYFALLCLVGLANLNFYGGLSQAKNIAAIFADNPFENLGLNFKIGAYFFLSAALLCSCGAATIAEINFWIIYTISTLLAAGVISFGSSFIERANLIEEILKWIASLGSEAFTFKQICINVLHKTDTDKDEENEIMLCKTVLDKLYRHGKLQKIGSGESTQYRLI
ncbi:MAG: hypothetical protein LUC34_00970 [Campylobacter sp.]|nr:hypothetical protein [Campylobacter sp.]